MTCATVLDLLIFFPGSLSKTFSADSQSAFYSEFLTPIWVRLALFGSFEENSHKMAQKIEKSVLVLVYNKITSRDHQVFEINSPLLYSLSFQSQQMYLRIVFSSVIGPGLFEFGQKYCCLLYSIGSVFVYLERPHRSTLNHIFRVPNAACI